MAKSKVAMVQAPPSRVKPGDQLADLLKKMGNNRAYTFIKRDGNFFVVSFEGDYHETRIPIKE